MSSDRYNIQWVGHCEFENKIWGWFFYEDPTQDTKSSRRIKSAYVFWARLHKKPMFKRHTYSSYDLNKLVKKKMSNSYNPINLEKIEEIWPTIYDDLDNQFIFHILAENV